MVYEHYCLVQQSISSRDNDTSKQSRGYITGESMTDFVVEVWGIEYESPFWIKYEAVDRDEAIGLARENFSLVLQAATMEEFSNWRRKQQKV